MSEPATSSTLTAETKLARFEALLDRPDPTRDDVDEMIALVDGLIMFPSARTAALYERMERIAAGLDYPRGRAFALGYRGYAEYMQSNHEQALQLLLHALEVCIEADLDDDRAVVLTGLANVYTSTGNYELALADALEALEILDRTGQRQRAAWCRYGIGTGYTEIGDLEQARRYFEDALAMFRDMGQTSGEGRCMVGLAGILQNEDRWEEAETLLQRGLALFRSVDDRLSQSRALNDLGCFYRDRGDPARAEDHFLRSLELRKSFGNRQAQSTTLIDLGRLYLQEDRLDDALDVLHRALDIARGIGARPREYRTLHALSKVYERQGDLRAALDHFQAYHDLYQDVFSDERTAAIRNIQARARARDAEHQAEITRLRNVELKATNDRLEALLAALHAAQDQLVQSEKMASLGRLMAGIAHEIRNPLNFINNFSHLSVELADELDEELRQVLEDADEPIDDLTDLLDDIRFNAGKIKAHGERAERIVHNMLDHARTDAGPPVEIDLNAHLDDYLDLAFHSSRSSDPDLAVEIMRDFDPAVGRVAARPQELGRVWINLLENAFGAVRERAASDPTAYRAAVRVSTRRRGDTVEVRIADNGPGVPESIRDRIFEPFFTTKPPGGGTGLGLSLSYDIVAQRHGGSLTLDDTDEGAAFLIALPAPAADA